MVIVAMTSNPAISPFSFIIATPDLVSGTLNRPGRVRVDKVYTLAQNIIVKTFGKVGDPVLEKIRQILGIFARLDDVLFKSGIHIDKWFLGSRNQRYAASGPLAA